MAGGFRMPRVVPILLVATLALPLLATVEAAHGGGHVAVANFRFADESTGETRTVVRAGESVTWTWRSGSIPHSVTSDALSLLKSFDSGVHVEGSPSHAFTVTFETPGVYPYKCRLHAGMTGTVLVTP